MKAYFGQLLEDGSDAFAVVWSVDALANAENVNTVMREPFRLAKPGAVLVSSNVIVGPDVRSEDLDAYRKWKEFLACIF